jgi:hypothetical protein
VKNAAARQKDASAQDAADSPKRRRYPASRTKNRKTESIRARSYHAPLSRKQAANSATATNPALTLPDSLRAHAKINQKQPSDATNDNSLSGRNPTPNSAEATAPR